MAPKRSAIRKTPAGRRVRVRYATRKTFLAKMKRKKFNSSRFSKNRMRTVSQNIIVKGMKKKLNTRSEMKYTLMTQTNLVGFNAPATTGILWDPDNVFNGGPARCITAPANAINEGGFIGTKFNSLFAIVRFMVEVTADTLLNDILRISVARPRVTPVANVVGTLPNAPATFINFWNTKDWDVMFDKTYSYVSQAGQITPPKVFQFKVPLKQTMGLTQQQIYPLWDRPPLILWSSRNGNQISCTNISCKFFYRDP